MALKLSEVVPFGRSFDEYRRIFALTEEDLGRRIISVADGPAGFWSPHIQCLDARSWSG